MNKGIIFVVEHTFLSYTNSIEHTKKEKINMYIHNQTPIVKSTVKSYAAVKHEHKIYVPTSIDGSIM